MNRLHNKEFIEKDIGLKLTVVMLIVLFVLAGIDFIVKSAESGVNGAFVVKEKVNPAEKKVYSDKVNSDHNLDYLSFEIEVVDS